jgi:RNA polymerase-binding transcription factor DksA
VIDIEEAERFADENDRASQITLHAEVEALDKHLRGVEKVPDYFDGESCIDCREEIPKPRLSTGAFRCLFCQTMQESIRKMRGPHAR